MDTFRNDEDGYLAWHESHEQGFVLNRFGGTNPAFNVLHRSDCTFLWRDVDEGARTAVEKWCSESEHELCQQADSVLGKGTWKRCGVCFRSSPAPDQPATPRAEAPASPVVGEDAPETSETVWISGEPSVWLGSGEKQWKSRVTAAFESAQPQESPQWIDIEFRLFEETLYGKDLDNLVTPVLESARDGGWVERGFARLGTVTARKIAVTDSSAVGVAVSPHADLPATKTERVGVLLETTLPSLDEATVKWARYENAIELYQRRPELRFPPQSPIASDVRVTVNDSGRRKSIGALMKPCIDGLEPILGHLSNLLPEPRESLQSRLAPQDEMVLSLAVHVHGGPSNHVSALISPAGQASSRNRS